MMMMNSPAAEIVREANQQTLEHSRKLSEHCRNVDRLIALNNRRIAKGLRPFPFPTPLVEAGRALVSRLD